jgi:DNA-binding response OmpR family regulator
MRSQDRNYGVRKTHFGPIFITVKEPVGANLIPTEKEPGNIKVLFVDDEVSILDSYTKYFEEKGFDVQGTETANEAIKLYTKWLPDVVVVDVHLAEGSGFSLLGRLTRVGAKVIVLTEDDSPENIITAMNRNARELLVKPVDLVRLQRAVQICA